MLLKSAERMAKPRRRRDDIRFRPQRLSAPSRSKYARTTARALAGTRPSRRAARATSFDCASKLKSAVGPIGSMSRVASADDAPTRVPADAAPAVAPPGVLEGASLACAVVRSCRFGAAEAGRSPLVAMPGLAASDCALDGFDPSAASDSRADPGMRVGTSPRSAGGVDACWCDSPDPPGPVSTAIAPATGLCGAPANEDRLR